MYLYIKFLEKHDETYRRVTKFLHTHPRKIPRDIVVLGNNFWNIVNRKSRLVHILILFLTHKINNLVVIPSYASVVSGLILRNPYQDKAVKTLENFVARCRKFYSLLIDLLKQLDHFKIFDMTMCGPFNATTRERRELLVYDKHKQMYVMIDIDALLSSIDPSQVTFEIVAKDGIELYSVSSGKLVKVQIKFTFSIPGMRILIKSQDIGRQCGINRIIDLLNKCDGRSISLTSGQRMMIVTCMKRFVICHPGEPFQIGKLWYVYTRNLMSFPTKDAALETSREYKEILEKEVRELRKRHMQCECGTWIQKEVTVLPGGALYEACNHITCPCGTTMCFRCCKTLGDCVALEAHNRKTLKADFEERRACQNHNRCPQHVINSDGDIVIQKCPKTCPGFAFQ